MNKLRLEIDALVVESFATAAADDGSGTVRGRMDVPREDTPGDIIVVPETQAKTCPYTCWETCGWSNCATNCSCITTPCTTCA
ncbi:MAG TPA: hypothetical protein VFJ82_01220 [Longimicrobium sp.]|nr:hypothetical protein [Longimicrobium sp.]